MIVLAPPAAVQLTARILQGLRDQPIEGGAVEGPRRRRRSMVDTDEDVVSVVGNAPSASDTTSLGLAIVIHGARISWKKIWILSLSLEVHLDRKQIWIGWPPGQPIQI
jgi:hypothetical protein